MWSCQTVRAAPERYIHGLCIPMGSFNLKCESVAFVHTIHTAPIIQHTTPQSCIQAPSQLYLCIHVEQLLSEYFPCVNATQVTILQFIIKEINIQLLSLLCKGLLINAIIFLSIFTTYHMYNVKILTTFTNSSFPIKVSTLLPVVVILYCGGRTFKKYYNFTHHIFLMLIHQHSPLAMHR